MLKQFLVKFGGFCGIMVDISLEKPYPANVLSNLYNNHFCLEGVECRSMEGFLQSLKYKDEEKQRQICGMTGKDAQKMATSAWQKSQTLWWKGRDINRQSKDFQFLLHKAYFAMFDQNDTFRNALLSTMGKTLCHSAGGNDPHKNIITEKEFCYTLTFLRDVEWEVEAKISLDQHKKEEEEKRGEEEQDVSMKKDGELLEMTVTLHAGMLANLITDLNAVEIRYLKLNGEINGTDVKIIRMMKFLQELDLSEAVIVAGGVPYYEQFTTENQIIGKHFLYGMKHLKKVILPKTITAIEVCAFADCRTLSMISIPPNVNQIDSEAFSGCLSLKEVVIEDGDECLDFAYSGDVFASCPIESVYLGREIDYLCQDIDDGFCYETYYSPFKENPLLKSIEIGNRVTRIADWAFAESKGLVSVQIHGVTEIGYNSFCFCNNESQLVLSPGASFSNPHEDWYDDPDFSRVVFTDKVTEVDRIHVDYYCKISSKIQLKGYIPPIVKGVAEKEVDKQGCTLYVPKGAAEAHRHAHYWKDFGNIIEVDE